MRCYKNQAMLQWCHNVLIVWFSKTYSLSSFLFFELSVVYFDIILIYIRNGLQTTTFSHHKSLKYSTILRMRSTLFLTWRIISMDPNHVDWCAILRCLPCVWHHLCRMFTCLLDQQEGTTKILPHQAVPPHLVR